jgi:hypothetical protein
MRFITRVTRVQNKESSVDRSFVLSPRRSSTVAQKQKRWRQKANKWRQSLRPCGDRRKTAYGKSRPHCEAHTSQASSAEPGTSLARSSHALCLDSCVVRASNATALAFRAPDPDAALL